MEQMTLTPSRRLEGRRAYERTAEPFNTAAWRSPTPHRFDAHVANDTRNGSLSVHNAIEELPAWLHIVGGGVVAALVGALLGGALHI